MENRHHLTVDTYEEGKLALEEYLDRVVFYQKRPFTRTQFRNFMFAQSKPYPEMIGLFRTLKANFGLKIVVVSNEARELNAHRIRKFKLDGFVDSFISSCFVHIRKPDPDIFRIALDIAGALPIRCCISKTRRCSWTSPKAWGFEAFFTPVITPPAPSLLRSGLKSDEDTSLTSPGSW